jgi:hypothetical protein
MCIAQQKVYNGQHQNLGQGNGQLGKKEACGTLVLPAIGTLCLFTIFLSHTVLHHHHHVTTFQNIPHPTVAPHCPYYKKAEGPFIQGKGILNHIGIPTTLNSEFPLDIYEGTLFCFVVMRSTEPGCFRSGSWYLWKALYDGLDSMIFRLFEKLSTRRGAWA